ncbi:MAG TPA: tRNA (adenosine(37)-N6)-threonylcarbamoyltransferase complex ATPase subunit type 1 TsaE, partial [Bauldia sp.]|nr:tRNA (adenosine(37)-N6)-threonylcarbamoyltransferase complex ATPase subunit type 1 TsaE [Bauldia sp.]
EGDVVALRGGLGAGKTTLARALIRSLAADAALEVPSPTFTLVQTYATPRLSVAHFDLYRVADSGELAEIGFIDAAGEGAVLVEWPERAGEALPAERLDVTLEIAGDGRRATIAGSDAVMRRVARSLAARAFLTASDWPAAGRCRIAGDASARAYERVVTPAGAAAVLMDWPASGQLPPGDPRARFRARDVSAFVAVAAALRAIGLSAPEIFAAGIGDGFVLMEDFGEPSFLAKGAPVPARYAVAVEALAAIHGVPRAAELPLPDGRVHRLPLLAGDALIPEIAVFADSYAPAMRGSPLAPSARDELFAIWRDLGERLRHAGQSWVLFDVQSANLFWLPERTGIARVGFIDFQDMFHGPAAYDVAALLNDARVTISPALQAALLDRYVMARTAADPAFDSAAFRIAFAVTAVLRTIKNMGAFARFAAAGNSNYVSHLPRLRAYLSTALTEPVLSPFALWYEKHVPS